VLDWPAVANIKSQIKRNRQNERRRLRNAATRSRLKTEARKVRDSAESGDRDAAVVGLAQTARQLDKAASKGMIHERTAARRKSALARQVSRAQQPPT
jgi:small subunit ribosomal protein S20